MSPATVEALKFQCSHCQNTLEVPVALAGTTGPCPACGTIIQAPFPELDERERAPAFEAKWVIPKAPPEDGTASRTAAYQDDSHRRRRKQIAKVQDFLRRARKWFSLAALIIAGTFFYFLKKNNYELPWKPHRDSMIWKFIPEEGGKRKGGGDLPGGPG